MPGPSKSCSTSWVLIPLSGKLVMVGLYLWVAVLGVASVRQTWLWRDPLSMWEATLKANPTSFAANNNLGLFLMMRGEYDRALTLFKRASELSPSWTSHISTRGRCIGLVVTTRRRRKCTPRQSGSIRGTSTPALYLAEILWKEGKEDEAIEYLKKSITRNPRSGKLHSELGLFYYSQGKEEDSLKEFTRAIELDPFLPVPYIQKGVILLSRGLPDEAIPLLKTAVGFAVAGQTLTMCLEPLTLKRVNTAGHWQSFVLRTRFGRDFRESGITLPMP